MCWQNEAILVHHTVRNKAKRMFLRTNKQSTNTVPHTNTCQNKSIQGIYGKNFSHNKLCKHYLQHWSSLILRKAMTSFGQSYWIVPMTNECVALDGWPFELSLNISLHYICRTESFPNDMQSKSTAISCCRTRKPQLMPLV